MQDIQELARLSLEEIRLFEKKAAALAPKKYWIEQVKNNPQNAASMYFNILHNLVKNRGTSDKDWEKLSLLIYFKVNPLAVKNEDGQNPFDYFYQKNREMRRSFHTPDMQTQSIAHQDNSFFISLSNRVYHAFKDTGLTDEQLIPLRNVQNLWNNYDNFLKKIQNTERIAFARLVTVVARNPQQALSVDEFQCVVQKKWILEQAEEKQAWEKWYQWKECNLGDQFYVPARGHARGYSSWKISFTGFFSPWREYLLYQPMPQKPQQALDDYLLSLRDIDADVTPEQILTPKRVWAYTHALHRATAKNHSR